MNNGKEIRIGTRVPVNGKGILSTLHHLTHTIRQGERGEYLPSFVHQIIDPSQKNGAILSRVKQGVGAGNADYAPLLSEMGHTFLQGGEEYSDTDPRPLAEVVGGTRRIEQGYLAEVFEIVALTRQQLAIMARPPSDVQIVTPLDYTAGTFISCPNDPPKIDTNNKDDGSVTMTLNDDYGPYILPDGRRFFLKKGIVLQGNNNCVFVRLEGIDRSSVRIQDPNPLEATRKFFDTLVSACGRVVVGNYNQNVAKNYAPWLEEIASNDPKRAIETIIRIENSSESSPTQTPEGRQ